MNFLRAHKSLIYLTFIFVCIGAALWFRGQYVSAFISGVTGVEVDGLGLVLKHDGFMAACIIGLFYLAVIYPLPRVVSVIAKVFAITVFAIYLIDYAVVQNFNVRLVAGDVVKYGDNVFYMMKLYGAAIFLFVGVALLLLAGDHRTKNRLVHCGFLFGILVFSGCSFRGTDTQYVHSWLYDNVIKYNADIRSEARPYTKHFIDSLDVSLQKTCIDRDEQRPNIIVLMVESLSSYHSALFSGLNDWTPYVDKLAEDNVALMNMYANGFVTEDGEIALLTGSVPLYAPQMTAPQGGRFFQGYYEHTDSLVKHLKKYNYHTEFLTTAPLEFSDTAAWAKSLGFDYLEDKQHAFYEDWPKFAFRAPPDEALYMRVLERISEQDAQPYFMFLKTVSSHHPFTNPETRKHSEEGTIRYVDRQIKWFHDKLAAHKFFDNGMLIIVGDHRAMTPVQDKEINIFGVLGASARVPALVIGKNFAPRIDSAAYQQTDLYNGLVNMTSNARCSSEFLGDPINNPPVAADYIVHRRGDRRDLLSVFVNGEEYEIRLNGDETAFVAEKPNGAEAIVDYVNTIRIHAAKSQN